MKTIHTTCSTIAIILVEELALSPVLAIDRGPVYNSLDLLPGSPSSQTEEPGNLPAILLSKGELAWTSSSCGSCHPTDSTFSHPVGLIPSMVIPIYMPLENGRITCATCHDNSQSLLHTQARANHTKLLRSILSDDQFCIQCHPATHRDRAGLHGYAVQKAHLRWPGKPDPKAIMIAGLDQESRMCLGCHDGSSAMDIGISNTVANGMDINTGNHSVGTIRHGNGMFANAWLHFPAPTDSRVRLFNNTVGCGSCHSVYSSQYKLLVISNQQSKLCLACHSDKR